MATSSRVVTAGSRGNKVVNGIVVNGGLAILCILWLIPTLGLLVSSLRVRTDITASGWWTVLPHQEYKNSSQIQLPQAQT